MNNFRYRNYGITRGRPNRFNSQFGYRNCGSYYRNHYSNMYDVIEDATNASELVNGVNKVNRFLTFSIDRETKEYVRLIAKDCFGNIRYIKAWK